MMTLYRVPCRVPYTAQARALGTSGHQVHHGSEAWKVRALEAINGRPKILQAVICLLCDFAKCTRHDCSLILGLSKDLVSFLSTVSAILSNTMHPLHNVRFTLSAKPQENGISVSTLYF